MGATETGQAHEQLLENLDMLVIDEQKVVSTLYICVDFVTLDLGNKVGHASSFQALIPMLFQFDLLLYTSLSHRWFYIF
jgi:hypothetical protein